MMKVSYVGEKNAVKTKTFYKSLQSLDNDARKIAKTMGSETIVIYMMSAILKTTKKREVLYVGQSVQVSMRMAQHTLYQHNKDHQSPTQRAFTVNALRNAKDFRYHILKLCGSPEEAAKYEHHYINALKPMLNRNDNMIGSLTKNKVNTVKAMLAKKQNYRDICNETGVYIWIVSLINYGIIAGDGIFRNSISGKAIKNIGLYRELYDIAKAENAAECSKRGRISQETAAELDSIAARYKCSSRYTRQTYRFLRVDWNLLFSFDSEFEE